MNIMKIFNLLYKIKKHCEKRCGGSSVNGICFNKIKFLKFLPSCKSVHPLQRSCKKSHSARPSDIIHKKPDRMLLQTNMHNVQGG